MRYYEILFEYRRDATRQRLGDRLLKAAEFNWNLGETYIPDELTDAAIFLDIAAMPPASFQRMIDIKSRGGRELPSYNITINNSQQSVPLKDLQQFVQQNLPAITDRIIQYFENRDPTPTKTYVPWMIQTFINEPSTRLEDYNRHDLIGIYNRYKNRFPERERNIVNFKTYNQFETAVQKIKQELNLSDISEKSQQINSADFLLSGEADVYYPEKQMQDLVKARIAVLEIINKKLSPEQPYRLYGHSGPPASAPDADGERIAWEWVEPEELTAAALAKFKQKNEGISKIAAAIRRDRPSDVLVIIPRSEAASCYFGQGTMWCTAATRGDNRFESYNRFAPLYIVLPMKPRYEGEKYQLYLGRSNPQFMDENDDEISLRMIQKRYPQFIKNLEQSEPELKDTFVVTSEETINRLLEACRPIVNEIAQESLNRQIEIHTSWDDYGYALARERGYTTDDGDIDWDQLHDDPDYSLDAYARELGLDNITNKIDEIVAGLTANEFLTAISDLNPEYEIETLNRLPRMLARVIEEELTSWTRNTRNRRYRVYYDEIVEEISRKLGVMLKPDAEHFQQRHRQVEQRGTIDDRWTVIYDPREPLDRR